MSPCIPWWGPMRPHGYGRFNLRRRSGEYAHRRVYEECFGLVPDGMVVHHDCANKACVNPEHLKLTTPEDHPDSAPGMRRAQTHCKYGHLLSGSNLLNTKGRVCRQCNIRKKRKTKEEQ